jgi:hypothetical protein
MRRKTEVPTQHDPSSMKLSLLLRNSSSQRSLAYANTVKFIIPEEKPKAFLPIRFVSAQDVPDFEETRQAAMRPSAYLNTETKDRLYSPKGMSNDSPDRFRHLSNVRLLHRRVLSYAQSLNNLRVYNSKESDQIFSPVTSNSHIEYQVENLRASKLMRSIAVNFGLALTCLRFVDIPRSE